MSRRCGVTVSRPGSRTATAALPRSTARGVVDSVAGRLWWPTMSTTIVWVSGGSRGIGRALIDTVPWPEARVIDLSRSGHPRVEHVTVDLAEPTGWEEAARSFTTTVADPDVRRAVFVHAAATLDPIGFAGEVAASAYRRQVLINSAAPQVLGDAFVRAVADRAVDAWLVMLTSGAATSVYEGWSAYGPAKAAVDHWVRTVGAERDRRGARCRVVAVAPGVVATAMQEEIRSTPEERFPAVARFQDLHARGELRDPEATARDIWRLMDRDPANGAVTDLRDLGT